MNIVDFLNFSIEEKAKYLEQIVDKEGAVQKLFDNYVNCNMEKYSSRSNVLLLKMFYEYGIKMDNNYPLLNSFLKSYNTTECVKYLLENFEYDIERIAKAPLISSETALYLFRKYRIYYDVILGIDGLTSGKVSDDEYTTIVTYAIDNEKLNKYQINYLIYNALIDDYSKIKILINLGMTPDVKVFTKIMIKYDPDNSSCDSMVNYIPKLQETFSLSNEEVSEAYAIYFKENNMFIRLFKQMKDHGVSIDKIIDEYV